MNCNEQHVAMIVSCTCGFLLLFGGRSRSCLCGSCEEVTVYGQDTCIVRPDLRTDQLLEFRTTRVLLMRIWRHSDLSGP